METITYAFLDCFFNHGLGGLSGPCMIPLAVSYMPTVSDSKRKDKHHSWAVCFSTQNQEIEKLSLIESSSSSASLENPENNDNNSFTIFNDDDDDDDDG